ncbi:unnamed protein product [Ceutorhynchus assimilis]|uniref:Carboxypeptidase n=1 Tax=Ceutorhynchus assimilis TaxID=467358 RepID=A0A9N9MNI8_9CUCU|nr:unnamed protein product [Ceutorhynchus assimilis]
MKVLLVFCLTATALASTLPDKPILQDTTEPLILTPYLEANKTQEAREAAQVNIEAFKNVSSYSGFLTVDKKNNSNLFFWFFKSESNYEEDPVVVWLQGGPGTSSLYGLFVENGPFGVVNGTVESRDFSWHKNHSVLYIDSPVGSGFSFTDGDDYVTNQTQVGDHLYKFLTQFFTMFPEIQKNEFYVSGESYAGKFVPAIAYTIHKNNPTASVKINLKGLLIGNGLSDPKHQFKYGALLYQLGFIDRNAADVYKKYENLIVQSIDLGFYDYAAYGWNQLIGSLFVEYTGLPNIFNFVSDADDNPTEWQDFIETAEIRKALHVGNLTFFFTSYAVYSRLSNDIAQSVAPWVSELLSHYRILIYNGQLDIMVSYSSTVNYLQNLNFSSSAEYAKAERDVWYVGNSTVAGYVKNVGNLTEVLVRNAGHTAIQDQPEATYDLVYKFIRGQTIGGK